MQRGAVQLQYVSTNEQVADLLTKALGRAKFVCFKEQMGGELVSVVGTEYVGCFSVAVLQ